MFVHLDGCLNHIYKTTAVTLVEATGLTLRLAKTARLCVPACRTPISKLRSGERSTQACSEVHFDSQTVFWGPPIALGRCSADLLAPVYGWFTEGSDTADLKDAKALLDDLA